MSSEEIERLYKELTEPAPDDALRELLVEAREYVKMRASAIVRNETPYKRRVEAAKELLTRIDTALSAPADMRDGWRDAVLEEAAKVAETTKLPVKYMWGEDEMGHFEFGCELAADAIRALKQDGGER